jgi:hypothetical protein
LWYGVSKINIKIINILLVINKPCNRKEIERKERVSEMWNYTCMAPNTCQLCHFTLTKSRRPGWIRNVRDTDEYGYIWAYPRRHSVSNSQADNNHHTEHRNRDFKNQSQTTNDRWQSPMIKLLSFCNPVPTCFLLAFVYSRGGK